MSPLLLLAGLALAVALLAVGRGGLAWVAAAAALLVRWWTAGPESAPLFWTVAGLVAALALLFGLPPLRAAVLGRPLLGLMRTVLPGMSETERAALEAGTVWWDGALFSGRPRWKELLAFQPAPLSERERAFLAGPVEELCALVDDWEVTQTGDLPPRAWELIKSKGFMGMIIPQEYGGLGFSAAAHSAVVTRLSTRSVTASVSVMVPNSLGPAELLHRYGTEEQKRHWLPRLARGEEVPCFALTGPENGSDAAAMEASGVVCWGEWEGQDTLGIRLRWDKRYTTLGPIATVIGLAFRLYDPEHLLAAARAERAAKGGGRGEGAGEGEAGGSGELRPPETDLGITVALVPARLPGIEIGSRHDPLGQPFRNGPSRGRDVFVPLDAIIGGAARAGHGWRMLMDCLAAGRSISLPSLSAGGLQLTLRTITAYAAVRRQFNLPIGRFEGVEERIARIAGLTYLADAARTLTAGAVDAGQQPAVLSAICKCYLTEAMRTGVNDGLDVLGGAGISRGPRNAMARLYQAVPIGITVEGANILTRSLIVYGQGAVRCHPFVHAEMEAVRLDEPAAFDRAFWGHVNHSSGAAARALLSALRDGGAPSVGGKVRARWLRRGFGRLGRLSAAFALISDTAMLTLGGSLKRREMLSGRLADGLAWMYLASAALKRHVDEGEPHELEPAARWALEHALLQARGALLAVLDNLPNRPAAWGLRALCFPWGRGPSAPPDRLSAELARALFSSDALRDGLTLDVHLPRGAEPGLGLLEEARAAARAAEAPERALRDARKSGRPQGEVLSSADRQALEAAQRLREAAVAVDAFEPEEYRGLRG